jgi:hypothetical protein
LQQWVATGQQPPDSRYSRIDHRSLVPLKRFVFPAIPKVTAPQNVFNTRNVYDRGQQYDAEDGSGIISLEPPIALAEYPALVPQVDSDGNDIDGVRSVTLQAPLGTYTGWSVRAAGFSEGDSCELPGSYIPFAVTKAQRPLTDPRPSLQERYGTLANYTAVATLAAQGLVRDGLLLPSDETAAIQSATNQAQQAGLK